MLIKNYLQRSLWNNLQNFWLQFKAWRFSKKPISGERKAFPPEGYEVVFEDDFKSESLDTNEWRYGHAWGFFHPNQLWRYWTKDAVEPTDEGIHLENKYLPKEIIKKDLPKWMQKPDMPDEFTIPWAVGLISSKRTFKFGWIEAEIKLPKEKMQWAAFWTCGWDTWPPEIDIFESYTDLDENDITLRPNIHWGKTEDGSKKDYGAPKIAVKDPSDRFVQYAVHWTDKFIKIYYDGQLVQICNNKEMLKNNAAEQYLVVNNGLHQPTESHQPTEGVAEVRNLKVYQKKS